MPQDYIPRQDQQALAFMQNFGNVIASNPGAYFVSASEAAAIQNLVAQFAAALTDSLAPEQRTPVNVAIKDEARNAAAQLIRQYATLIKYNAGIPNPAKIAVGVRPVNPNRERVDCPQTAPKLNVLAATFGTHTLKFADSLTEESGAKPFGASELQLFVAIDDEIVPDSAEAKFYGKFTKNPVAVAFVHADNGKQATYYGRWGGRRGDFGPFSGPVTLTIAA